MVAVMSESKRDEKQAKREARQLWDEGRAAQVAGDHRHARATFRRLADAAPDSELGEKARLELEAMRPDRKVLLAGAGATLLYLLGWIVALW